MNKITTFRPQNQVLNEIIDFFIYFDIKASSGQEYNFKTFPNLNKCLAIYLNGQPSWNEDTNICEILRCSKPNSALFHNHKRPFNVKSTVSFKQFCIIFKEDGLNAVSQVPIEQIHWQEAVEQIFQNDFNDYEAYFDDSKLEVNLPKIEFFLMKKLINSNRDGLFRTFLSNLNQFPTLSISQHAQNLRMDESTLYRKLKMATQKSPKQIQKEFIFRKTLNKIQNNSYNKLIDLCDIEYYDQSHFIKNFQQFTGLTPKQIQRNISSTGPLFFMTA